jgi:hypothetical protein
MELSCAQTGAGTGLPCGDEFDLFLSPVDSGVYPLYPVNVVPSQPLANLSSLVLQFGANVRCCCGPR